MTKYTTPLIMCNRTDFMLDGIILPSCVRLLEMQHSLLEVMEAEIGALIL
jgi:hypothetical protein